MTREEAIEKLKCLRDGIDEAYSLNGAGHQMFDMAIKALKAQDVPDTNVGDMISRQAAIARAVSLNLFGRDVMIVSVSELENLPSAQPVLDRTKISDLLEKIYAIQSVHLSVEGVLARKYYCKQLWIELFGSEDVPKWID